MFIFILIIVDALCALCPVVSYFSNVSFPFYLFFACMFWMLNVVSFDCSNSRLFIVLSFILCWKNSVFIGNPGNGGS